jgi:PTH2 family peptidyl-tRNA hydrolase
MKTKQVIVMRTDLNMRKGKMVAQGAHASLAVFLNKMRNEIPYTEYVPEFDENDEYTMNLKVKKDSSMDKWLRGNFRKITLGIKSEEELFGIYDKARQAGLPHALICDDGLTEFHGLSTYTCVAIGPAEDEEIDKITGNLKPI